jgi:tetratricopeptide (TPR) repeat protein
MSDDSGKIASKIGVYVAPGGYASIGTQNIEERKQLNPPKYIPYKGVNNFVGREEEMKLLHSKLQRNDAVAISAIAGMGGVGKTELATQYARQHEADYPGGICWLNARDANLAAEIIQFYQFYVDNQREIPQELGGRQLTVSEQAIWCWENWQPSEGLILVIWDDVTDLGSCQQLLPKNNRFRLLITTRLRNLDPNIVEEIPLDILSPQKSVELLTALISDTRLKKEPEIAAELCKWLGYLPLGLELVGRYVADDPDLSLKKMLESLQQQRLDNEALEHSTESWTTAQRGVLAAFELTWNKLDSRTQQVAELLSLFSPDVIPWKLVQSICERLGWSKADSNKAKKQLYKNYLIQRLEGKDSTYKVHSLIRQFLQAKLELEKLPKYKILFKLINILFKRNFPKSSANKFKQAFIKEMLSIAQKIPPVLTITDIELVKDTIPHLKEVAESLITVMENENLIFWAFIGIARFYEGQGLYILAESWRKQCISVLLTRLGEEHPYVATSYNNLAALYQFQGRYKEAEPLFQKALSLRERLLGEKHPDVAQAYNNLAFLHKLQGRYKEAELLFQKALSLRERLLGEKHPDVAQTYNNLAGLYYSQGRYKEAEPLYQKALSLRERLLGEEHPDVAQTYNNLARLYYSQGRYKEAEPLYQKALSLGEQLLGEEHPDMATIYNNLAALYQFQGRYKEAEPLYQKALSLRERLLGEEHPDVAMSYNNLAALYKFQERYKEAEPLYQKALAICEQMLGVDHPNTVTVCNNLKDLRNNMGYSLPGKRLLIKKSQRRKKRGGKKSKNR